MRNAAREQVSHLRRVGCHVVGMRDLLKGLANQFAAFVTNDPAELIVDRAEPASKRDIGDADRCSFEQGAEPRFARREGFLYAFAVGDVGMRAHGPQGPVARITLHDFAARENPDPTALLVPEPVLGLVEGADTPAVLVQSSQDGVLVLWMDEAFPGREMFFELSRPVTQHVEPSLAEPDIPADDVPIPDTVIGALQSEGEARLFRVEALLTLPEIRGGRVEGIADLTKFVEEPRWTDHRFAPSQSGRG